VFIVLTITKKKIILPGVCGFLKNLPLEQCSPHCAAKNQNAIIVELFFFFKGGAVGTSIKWLIRQKGRKNFVFFYILPNKCVTTATKMRLSCLYQFLVQPAKILAPKEGLLDIKRHTVILQPDFKGRVYGLI